MTRPSSKTNQEYSTFSSLTSQQREDTLRSCNEITEGIYPGLDVRQEILSVSTKNLGDTVLLMEEGRVEGFAVCHVGAGTEAGSDLCYVKFAAVPPNSNSTESFSKLVNSCIGFAASKGVQKIEASVNLGRSQAYETLAGLGFTTLFQGVAMQRPNEPGYNRPDVFVIDDWR